MLLSLMNPNLRLRKVFLLVAYHSHFCGVMCCSFRCYVDTGSLVILIGCYCPCWSGSLQICVFFIKKLYFAQYPLSFILLLSAIFIFSCSFFLNNLSYLILSGDRVKYVGPSVKVDNDNRLATILVFSIVHYFFLSSSFFKTIEMIKI